MPVTVDDLHTAVQNTSQRRRFFAYLTEQGMTLEPDEEVQVRGDLGQNLAGTGSIELWNAFRKDLREEIIAIRSTPVRILRDETTGASKALVLNSGTLAVIDPAWGQLDSLGGGI